MKKPWSLVLAVVPLVVIGSVAVWQVSGSDRRIGAITAASEPVPLSWRGPYSGDAAYAPGQVVSFDGASYVADQETKGEKPGCSGAKCPWSLMASRGAPGPAGSQGAAGPQGVEGPAGTTGQSISTVKGTGSLYLQPGTDPNQGTPFEQVPGLSQTVTVPANAKVFVSSQGGVRVNEVAPSLDDRSVVQVSIIVDGQSFNNVVDAQPIEFWSMSGSFSLAAGTHTITVKARQLSGPESRVSDGSSANIGVLTVMILKG